MFAAMFGHVAILEELLRNGARVDNQDAVGGTALMKAAARGHVKCVSALLDAKCIIDAEVSVSFLS
jgi:ankyrin repeat protein